MKLHHLAALHEVAATGSVSAASKRLGISQPAVTKQLHALEQEVGHPLFSREGGKLVPTETLRTLLPDVSRLLRDAEVLRTALSAPGSTPAETLRIGSGRVFSRSVLPQAIARCRKQFPHIAVTIESSTSVREAARQVRDASLDMAFGSDHLDDPGLHFEPLFEDELVLITPTGHKLAGGGKPIPLRRIRGEHIIIHFYARYIENALRKAGIHLSQLSAHNRLDSQKMTTETIATLVAQGEGVSIVPRYLISLLNMKGITLRRIRPVLPVQFGYYKLRSARLTAAEKTFLDVLRAVIDQTK